jgi:hypothetical protein
VIIQKAGNEGEVRAEVSTTPNVPLQGPKLKQDRPVSLTARFFDRGRSSSPSGEEKRYSGALSNRLSTLLTNMATGSQGLVAKVTRTQSYRQPGGTEEPVGDTDDHSKPEEEAVSWRSRVGKFGTLPKSDRYEILFHARIHLSHMWVTHMRKMDLCTNYKYKSKAGPLA